MPTFFDLLPTDISDNIAYHLFSSIKCHEYDYVLGKFGLEDDEALQTLLEYAKESNAHLRSVMWAMSHSIDIPIFWRAETTLNWISVTASQLQRLNLQDAQSFSFTGKPPKLPKLLEAAIISEPEQLSLIRGCPKLTDLKIIVNSTRQWEYIISTIAFLPLKSLEMVFNNLSIEEDVVRSELETLSRVDLMSLLAACPTLEKFFLNLNPIPLSITSDAWDMIQRLPSLKTLAIKSYDIRNEKHISFIQSVPEIELYDFRWNEQAQRFGAAVTFLEVFNPSSYEQISQLTYFPNVRKLRLTLQQGAEMALVGKTEEAESLSLSWHFVFSEHPLVPLVETYGGSLTASYPVYSEPDIEILEKILRTTRNLKALRLEDAILSSDTIDRLLVIAGDILEKLELCQDWQQGAAPRRMERILKAVARYCPRLKSLIFPENSVTSRYFIISTEDQKKRCLQALQELVSARPGFQTNRNIRDIIEQRFVMERPWSMLLWDDIILNE